MGGLTRHYDRHNSIVDMDTFCQQTKSCKYDTNKQATSISYPASLIPPSDPRLRLPGFKSRLTGGASDEADDLVMLGLNDFLENEGLLTNAEAPTMHV